MQRLRERAMEVPDVDEVGEDGRKLRALEQRRGSVQGCD